MNATAASNIERTRGASYAVGIPFRGGTGLAGGDAGTEGAGAGAGTTGAGAGAEVGPAGTKAGAGARTGAGPTVAGVSSPRDEGDSSREGAGPAEAGRGRGQGHGRGLLATRWSKKFVRTRGVGPQVLVPPPSVKRAAAGLTGVEVSSQGYEAGS